MHQRGLPGRRATIDHIVVGPAGVYVIDTHDVGSLAVRLRRDRGASAEGRKDLVIGRRVENHLLGALDARVEIVRTTLDAAGLPDVPVVPVLCVVEGAATFGQKHLQVAGTHIVGPTGLAQLVCAGGALDGQQRTTLHAMLNAALPPAARALARP